MTHVDVEGIIYALRRSVGNENVAKESARQVGAPGGEPVARETGGKACNSAVSMVAVGIERHAFCNRLALLIVYGKHRCGVSRLVSLKSNILTIPYIHQQKQNRW